MQNQQGIAIAAAIAFILIGGAWYLNRPSSTTSSPNATSITPTTTVSNNSGVTPITTPPAPAGGTNNTNNTATPPSTTPVYAANTLPISPKDTLASWNFQGSHSDSGALQQKTESQIASLKTKIDESNPTVQEIYISIAQQYELLGDGKSAYIYFLQALNSKQRYEQEDGMAWAGLGDLMERLHAYYTAATAYANAVKAIPTEPSFHVARISFLLSSLPKETALVDAAFADAAKYVPGDASVAQLKAQYQKTQAQ